MGGTIPWAETLNSTSVERNLNVRHQAHINFSQLLVVTSCFKALL